MTRSVVDLKEFAAFEAALTVTLQYSANDCARYAATNSDDHRKERKYDNDRNCTRHALSVVRSSRKASLDHEVATFPGRTPTLQFQLNHLMEALPHQWSTVRVDDHRTQPHMRH